MNQRIVIGILILFLALSNIYLYAEGQTQTTPPKKVRVIAKPKPTTGNLKRLPGTYLSIECTVDSENIFFVSPIWEDGMIVHITSDDGTEWTDIITDDDLAMPFIGHNPGLYTIEYLPVSAGLVYIGEFSL